MMQRWGGVLAGIGLGGLAVGLGALYLIGAFPTRGMRCFGRTTFAVTKWRAGADDDGRVTARGCMIDDYLRRHPPVGRSREEIVRELGVPRETGYFRDYDLVYWLGPERGLMALDSEWLVVRFDSSGRAVEGKLVTD
jgi:hypothetical protein